MKRHLLIIALALCLVEGKVLAQESTAQPADNQQAMPDTTDLNAMFDYIDTALSGEEQARSWRWLITKMKAAKPVDKKNLVGAINNYAMLLSKKGQLKEAQSCFQEALAVTQKMMDKNDVLGWFLSAMTRVNSTNAIEKDDPNHDKKMVQQCDIATSDADHFIKDSRADPDDVVGAEMVRAMTLWMSTIYYSNLKQYDKVLSRGARHMDTWNVLGDAMKKEKLYLHYMAVSSMCEAAVKRGLEDKFRELAKDIESFLGNVSEQYQAGKVSFDEETQRTLVYMCTYQMQYYAELRDFERSEQLAALASTLDKNAASLINYERCNAMIQCGKEEDARKLYAEVIKDKDFVSNELKDGDRVKEALDKLDANGGSSLDDQDLSSLTNAIAQNVGQRRAGGGRITIQGMTKETLAPRQERNGRVILPIDHVKQIGVGINIHIGK